MTTELFATIVGLCVTLGGALVFTVKALLSRMEDRERKAAEEAVKRDAYYRDIQTKLIESLSAAVKSFNTFESEERETHTYIMKTQQEIVNVLNKIVDKLASIDARLSERQGS